MAESSDQTKSTGAMSMLRHCLNPKVLAGLAVVGLVIWVTQPQLIRSILPVLFLLACPLSMVFMMRAMGGSSEKRSARADLPVTPEPVDRPSELRERLARARAEEEVLQSELVRLEAEETIAGDDREPLPRAPTEDYKRPTA